MNGFIELGSISGYFGVKGWVKLYSHTRPRDGIADYSQFYCGDTKQPVTFTTIKASGKYIIGQIADIHSREAATPYIGKALFIKREDLPQLDNEYYWQDLVGLTVINQHNQVLGKIVEMMETGANDVMVIHSDNGEETLIPYAVSHFVLSVSLEQGEMRVNWELDSDIDAEAE